MKIKRLLSTGLVLVMCSISALGFGQGKDLSNSNLDVYHINSEYDYMGFYLDKNDLSTYTSSLGSNMYSIVNKRTYMRLRSLSEALGITLYWNSKEKEVSFDTDGERAVLKIGSKNAKVGSRNVLLDYAPYIQDGYTFIPLRFISESLGVSVNYVDMRQEGEIIKNVILKNYPSIERIIESGAIKQGSSYVTPRLRVSSYDPNTHMMEVVFEQLDESWEHKGDLLNTFVVDRKNRTIYDSNENRVVIVGYDEFLN